MEVTFYRFAKRVNSTKRPSGGSTLQAVMKDKTDLHNPTIAVKDVADNFNYFSIGTDYYYVTSRVVMPSNWVEYTGVIDPMATYADAIKATRAFVVRSQSAGIDTLVDSLAPATSTETSRSMRTAMDVFTSGSGGAFIVRFANVYEPAIMSVEEFISFYDAITSQDLYDAIKEYFIDVSSMVLGVKYVPIERSRIVAGGRVPLKAGFFDTGISVDISREANIEGNIGFVTTKDGALGTSSYRHMTIYLPFAGSLTLAPEDFYNGVVNITYSIDPLGGGIAYVIKDANNGVVASASGNCSTDFTFGTTETNLGILGNAIIGGGVGALTGNPLGALVGAVSTVISSGALTSSSGIGGGASSVAGLAFTDVELTIIDRETPEAIHNKAVAVGLPTFKTLTLGSLSGFVQCQGASVECEGNAEECGEINGFLNNGAFIE